MAYTPELLAEFDRLTMQLSSLNNLQRIKARLAISAMKKEHGKDVLDEMFAVLRQRDETNG